MGNSGVQAEGGTREWRRYVGPSVDGADGISPPTATSVPRSACANAANALTSPNHAADLVQVDTETGALDVLATLAGIGIRNSTLRLAATADGDFFVTSEVSSSDFGLYRVDGATLEPTEIPLRAGVRIVAVTDLDVDTRGDALLVARDTRINAAGLFVLFRVDTDTGETSIALGNRLSPPTALAMAVGPEHGLYFTSGGGTTVGDPDRVFGQSRRPAF